MARKSVLVLDIIALLLTGTWIIFNALRGLSTSDLVFSYLYSIVVLIAFIITLIDQMVR